MLTLLGSRKTLCDGLSRRDLLHVGSIGALGLALPDALGPGVAAAAAAGASFGRAKSCILLFLFGAPPQHETFDPKPSAPVEIQGEMRAIPTRVPGIQIGEGLPRVSRVIDRTTVVRSMNHPYPLHACAYALTGMPEYSIPLETAPRDPRHWPFFGSVVDYALRQRGGGRAGLVPHNVGLPWRFCSRGSSPNQAGPYGAFLGSGYDPVWSDFDGKGTRVAPKLYGGQEERVYDPHYGIEPTGRFHFTQGPVSDRELSAGRLDARRHLLTQFDRLRPALDRAAETGAFAAHQERAFSLLGSGRVRDALDVQREPTALREAYGMTLFGQACLAARRLVEAGVKFVTVFWDPFGPHGASVWDTHYNHFHRLKNYLLPVLDQTYSALILDLEQRGLLDETLVLCFGEHGRTPRIDPKPAGAARHHWSRTYSAILAGGGVARGRVVGRSNRIGGDVADVPVSPKDLHATTYHLLGIDPHGTMPDRFGRPLHLAGGGEVRHELLG